MAVTLVARARKGGGLQRLVFDATANVGRDPSNDLVLPGENIEDHHARFIHREGRTQVVDLRSRSGTFVNGRRIEQATIIRDGDAAYIGDWRVTVERAEHVAETVRAIEAALPLMPDDELPPDTDRGDRTPTPLVPPPPSEPDPFVPRDERERGFFDAVAQTPGDDALRQVYADWLEENGHRDEAELISLEREIRAGGEHIDAQELARLGYRLRQVAGKVPLAWRAVVARPAIEGCTGFSGVCPRAWDRLVPNGVFHRVCDKCARNVSFEETTFAARGRLGAGQRVVIDVAAERHAGDLRDTGARHGDVQSVTELPFFGRAEPPRTVADVLASLGVTAPQELSSDAEMGFLTLPPMARPDAEVAGPLTPLVARLSIQYHFDHYHHRPSSSFADIGYKGFSSVTVSFRTGARAIDAWLQAHHGEPRIMTSPSSSTGYPGTLHRVYGSWLLSHFAADGVVGDGSATLEWVESLPEWALAPTKTADALAWLAELAQLVRGGCSHAELETFAARPPRQSGIVVVGQLNKEDFHLGFEPPLSASDVARAFEIKDPIGHSGDVHMSTWEVVERDHAVGQYPRCGPWAIEITLDGWPSGESVPGYGSKELGAQDRARGLRIARPR